MTTPIEEKEEPRFPVNHERSSDEEGTVIGDSNTPYRNMSSHGPDDNQSQPFLAPLKTSRSRNDDNSSSQMLSPSHNREQAHRLDDDLHLLQIERAVSADLENKLSSTDGRSLSKARSSAGRSRVRHEEPVDEFDVATNPLHERTQVYSPPHHPENAFAKFFAKVHASNWLVRYFTYITPVVIVLLVPILIGFELPAANGTRKNSDGSCCRPKASVGGVEMTWFCIWLMIVWLALWAGRVSDDLSAVLIEYLANAQYRFSPSACPGLLQ